MKMPVDRFAWHVNKLLEQKKAEKEAMEKALKKARKK